MTDIYLIRHAEADGNIYSRCQGQYESRLTLFGIKQLEPLADRFEHIKLDAVYASDLRRTMMTAGAVARGKPLAVTPDKALREVYHGVWEDMSWAEIDRDYGEQLQFYTYERPKWHVPGCEPYEAHFTRFRDEILRLAREHDGQTIACVSHGSVMNAFFTTLFGMAVKKTPPDNTCVSLIHVDGDRIDLEYIYDNSHLKGGYSTIDKQRKWRELFGYNGASMLFDPIDLDREAEFYMDCRRDAWIFAHGSDKGFSEGYLELAREHARGHELALVKASLGGKVTGVLELDTVREAEENAGWISFYYMLPEYRGKHLAVQLLGHASSIFKKLGRTAIRLCVAEGNERAIKFYKEYDFRPKGLTDGAVGKLIVMEKDIS